MVRYFLGDLEVVIIFIEIAIMWQICTYFFINSIYKREEKEISGNLTLASGAFFLGYSLYKLFSLLYQYYGGDPVFRLFDRIFLVIGAILFIVLINQIYLKQVFENDKLRMIFVLTLLGNLGVFVSLYYLFSNLEFLLVLLIVLSGLMAVLIYFSIDWMKKTGNVARNYMLLIMGGALIFLCGAAFGRIIRYIPQFSNIYTIFNVLEMFGLITMGISAFVLPRFDELNWKENIINIYIIKSEGICLYERNFQEGEDVDRFLISGGITTIIKFVKEVTKSDKQVSTIKQEGKNIIIEYGKNVIVAIVAKQDMNILHEKANKLVQEYEEFFKEIFPGWKGDLEFFKPSSVLVDKIFT